MKFIPVKVRSHSGYKADEYPESIMQDNREILIENISDRWYQGDINPEFPPADYFKVVTTGNRSLIIKHDLSEDAWYLCIQEGEGMTDEY